MLNGPLLPTPACANPVVLRLVVAVLAVGSRETRRKLTSPNTSYSIVPRSCKQLCTCCAHRSPFPVSSPAEERNSSVCFAHHGIMSILQALLSKVAGGTVDNDLVSTAGPSEADGDFDPCITEESLLQLTFLEKKFCKACLHCSDELNPLVKGKHCRSHRFPCWPWWQGWWCLQWL